MSPLPFLILGILLVEGLQNAPAWAGVFLLRTRKKSLVLFTLLMVSAAVILELTEPVKLWIADQPQPAPQLSFIITNSLIFILAGLVINLYLKFTDRLASTLWFDLVVVVAIGVTIGLSQSETNYVHALALGLAGILTLYSLRTKDTNLMIGSWAASSFVIALLDYIIPYLF